VCCHSQAKLVICILTLAGQILFVRHPVHDADVYKSLEDLTTRIDSYGYGSGVDLLKVGGSCLHLFVEVEVTRTARQCDKYSEPQPSNADDEGRGSVIQVA
jgi:hypothetical protein